MTKLDVLTLLASARDLDAGAMSRQLRTSVEASGMMLMRLMRQGLVVRELDDAIFVYQLTAKGDERRAYLTTRTPGIRD